MEEAGQERVAKETLLSTEFLDKLKGLGTVEEKLESLLSFMRQALEDGGGHRFREFWKARKLCGDFFTKPIHPLMRARLWSGYTDLCREARALKNLFDEQSSFLVEQIEKAIDGIEVELPLFHEKGEKLPPLSELTTCSSLQKHVDRYEVLYHELQYLNSFALRIGSLRKELLMTDMRFKQRNRLLDRLTKLGDVVFPKRKQAISEVSVLFVEDVETFVSSINVNELKPTVLFDAREEIKRLQDIAKKLTLGTDGFSKVRALLGNCWDNIKEDLKERRKAEHDRREAFKKYRDEFLDEITKVKGEIEEKKFSQVDAKRALQALQRKIREVPLARQDVHLVRDRLKQVEETLSQPVALEARVSERRDNAFHAAWFQEFNDRLKGPFEEKHVEEALHNLLVEAEEHSLSREEKLGIEEAFLVIRDQVEALRIRFAKEAIEETRQDELLALEHLYADCKQRIDAWRKEASASGSDFSYAIRYTDLIERERERLVRIDELIEQLSLLDRVEK